jgi:hypothetical protein
MKPGFGPVFQFRATFSLGRPVDELWTGLNIVAGSPQRLRSQQQELVSGPSCSLVQHSGGP